MDWQQQAECEYARWIAEGCPPIEDTHELSPEERAELNAWLDALETKMPTLDDIYPDKSDTLKAADLKGKAFKVKIAKYDIKEFKDKNGIERKACLWFEGREKGLVVNKTNGRMIAKNVGSHELNDWIGHTITIYPTQVDFGGDMVDAIRVKEEVPEAVEDIDDDIPF